MPDSNLRSVEALYKILLKEQETGFRDKAVFGGLDRFLQHWALELQPVLGEFKSYSLMLPSERGAWAISTINHLSKTIRRPANPQKEIKTPDKHRTERSIKPTPVLSLDDPVGNVRGTNRRIVPLLKELGVTQVKDLLTLYPNRYNDFGNIRKISQLKPGEDQTVVVTVWEASVTRHSPKQRSTQAMLGDDTGNVRAIWFNQPYLVKTFKPGTSMVISGRVSVFKGSFVFESPEYELLAGQEELVHTGRLVPVYPLVKGLSQRTLRRLVKSALDACTEKIEEYLPDESLHRTRVQGLRWSITQVHYPDSSETCKTARQRLAFDEMLLLELAVLSQKLDWQQRDRAIPMKNGWSELEAFLHSLPFSLTGAQAKVLDQVLADMRSDRPMSRLIQGDVGSGKTVIALAAMLLAVLNGHQAAIMAPTELLAEQHFVTISRLLFGITPDKLAGNVLLFAPRGYDKTITLGLLVGSLSNNAKQELRQRISQGEVDLVIGTHALIQEEVDIPRLALVVVDEQHRFGVVQRATLREKGKRPHLLAMSATPIPRSLALTLYGDLDISVIDELPPGRQPIRTRLVGPEERSAAYNFVRSQVVSGRQAFIVCPLIEESEVIQTRAAVKEFERLSKDVFPDLRLELLHGRLPMSEKGQSMARFQKGQVDILVSTPVVEVGIDVPNATVMLIDGADRFGLAQLHQFRGRVGRGRHQSYCLLLSDKPRQEVPERLRVVERVQDGFELAEEDLRLRGPGDYIGTRQSGLLPDLKIARITDHDTLMLARREAIRILESDPELSHPEHSELAKRIKTTTSIYPGEMS